MHKLPAPLPLDHQLCFAIHAASIALNRLYKPILDGYGLTYPQYLVLSVLWQQDGQTVGALADQLALEPSTVTPLLKRLEAAGFVQRARSKDDERKVIITLTERARALHFETKCLSETLLEKSELQPPDIIRLNAEINALRSALVRNAAPAGTASEKKAPA